MSSVLGPIDEGCRKMFRYYTQLIISIQLKSLKMSIQEINIYQVVIMFYFLQIIYNLCAQSCVIKLKLVSLGVGVTKLRHK